MADAAIEVRPARVDEAEAVLALLRVAVRAARGPRRRPGTRTGRGSRLVDAIDSDSATILIAVAADSGAIAGFCSAYLDLLSVRYGLRCWVEDLAVDPDRRSRGIGGELLAAAREWAAARRRLAPRARQRRGARRRPPLLRARGRRDALVQLRLARARRKLVSAGTRSGFIGLAGRPNVGKSTLANSLVGSKVAIVSDRPQTTRRAVRGVATAPDGSWQMVLTDLPGVQKPRDVLTERMQKRVERELADSDAVLLRPQRRAGGRARRPLHRLDDRGGATGGAGDLRGQQDRPPEAARADRGAGRRGRARGRRRGLPDQRPPRDRGGGPARAARPS